MERITDDLIVEFEQFYEELSQAPEDESLEQKMKRLKMKAAVVKQLAALREKPQVKPASAPAEEGEVLPDHDGGTPLSIGMLRQGTKTGTIKKMTEHAEKPAEGAAAI